MAFNGKLIADTSLGRGVDIILQKWNGIKCHVMHFKYLENNNKQWQFVISLKV